MKEITLTHGKVTQVDDEDYGWLSKWKWFAHYKNGQFYAARRANGKLIYMHVEIMRQAAMEAR